MIDWLISSLLGSNINFLLEELSFVQFCALLSANKNSFQILLMLHCTFTWISENKVMQTYWFISYFSNIPYHNSERDHLWWKMQKTWEMATSQFSHTSIGWAMDCTKQRSNNEFAVCFLTQNNFHKNILIFQNGRKMQDNWQIPTYSHTSMLSDGLNERSVLNELAICFLNQNKLRKKNLHSGWKMWDNQQMSIYSHTSMLSDLLNVRLGEQCNQCNQLLIALAFTCKLFCVSCRS